MSPGVSGPEVVVVGAGLTGLTAAYRLAQAGWKPRVFERYPRPGGLARVLTVNGERLEAFYHHLFTTDTAYTALADELGIGSTIEWLPSRMGIFTDNRLWDFGTPQSLFKLKPLPWLDKIRFVVQTLALQRREEAPDLEAVTAERWIRRHMGEAVWRTIWGPLLHQKFSTVADEVAMVWIWRKLYLRGRSRSTFGLGEKLGYMKGSFAVLVEALAEKIENLGGSISLSDPVQRIDRHDNGFEIHTKSASLQSPRLLAALPAPDFLDIAGHVLDPKERTSVSALRATSALCTVLELDRSLSPYYWLNIADETMPFGGLIEHTNYIERERYGGTHILYISNYLLPDDPLNRASKSEVLETYIPALRRINPEFDSSWIVRSHHFRAAYAQPIIPTGYRRMVPKTRTGIDKLYFCSMAHIFPEDRGQNFAVLYGDRVARQMLEDAGPV